MPYTTMSEYHQFFNEEFKTEKGNFTYHYIFKFLNNHMKPLKPEQVFAEGVEEKIEEIGKKHPHWMYPRAYHRLKKYYIYAYEAYRTNLIAPDMELSLKDWVSRAAFLYERCASYALSYITSYSSLIDPKDMEFYQKEGAGIYPKGFEDVTFSLEGIFKGGFLTPEADRKPLETKMRTSQVDSVATSAFDRFMNKANPKKVFRKHNSSKTLFHS